MVTTKVRQIKNQGSLKRIVSYILDERKTTQIVIEPGDEFGLVFVNSDVKHQIVSGHLILDEEEAAKEMMMTNMEANRRFGRPKLSDRRETTEVYAHHIIQSFSPDDDLTPEQVHEIGRRTAMELTGGHHEFVVATHMDKDHLHNHIIFNATNSSTLKKFRWQKGTKRSLEKISDRHAETFGAKIIEKQDKIFDHKRYVAYQRENIHKVEIKSRLEFLLKQSTSVEDFLLKAKALDLAVDTSGKYVTYRLLDRDQERNTRDRNLSKKGRYSVDGIAQRVSINQAVYSVDEIKSKYQELQEEKANDFELRLSVPASQVTMEVPSGIYVEVDYGLINKGLVKIPYRMVDKLEDGSFEIFVKRSDHFYFTNPDKADKNRFMKGDILVKQLAYKNDAYILKKNPNISKLDQLVREFSFLNQHGVTKSEQLDELTERFKEQLQEADQTLDLLNDRIARLNKIKSALEAYWDTPPYYVGDQLMENELARQILEDYHFPLTYPIEQLDKELVEVSVERTNLEEKLNQITFDYKKAETIKDNHREEELGK